MLLNDDDEEFEDTDAEGVDTEEEADLAEEAAMGKVCSKCGVEFEKAHGAPVLCTDCWNNSSKEEKTGLVKATIDEVIE